MATYAEPRAPALPSRAQVVSIARRWPIIGILALQALICLIMLNNTTFQDEALYLYAGRQIIHHWNGGPPLLENYSFYFSGYPYVYPVVGGFLDMLGGLELARDFSLACMLGVTVIVYAITARLFGRRAAVFASAAYASTGSALFLGRLATFDAMCLLLIAAASALAVYGGMSKHPWGVLGIGPILVLAILAKYAALLFIPPVFALLACLAIPFLGYWRAIARSALAAVSFAISAGVAYKIMDKSAFHAINGSTTSRDVILKEPRLDLFLHVLQMAGPQLFLAVIGLLLTSRLQWRYRMLAVVLFGSAWLAPVYHIYVQESISLDKHIAYAAFFAMPLAGYALGWLSGYGRVTLFWSLRGYWLAGVATVLAIFTLGISQARNLYAGWANTTALSTALHSQLRDGSGRIMAEDIEVTRFDAMDVTEPWQWSGLRFLYYKDATGHQYLGNPAIVHSLQDRYYDWVELSFIYIPDEANFTAAQMAQTRNYDLIGELLFSNSYGKGHYYLFRLAMDPGQGDFTSMAQLAKVSWVS
jgi:4-amino-4-deoxy-L-arabinose transferase-like glycosyltransferase